MVLDVGLGNADGLRVLALELEVVARFGLAMLPTCLGKVKDD
jgi:hypothetical protein